MQADVFLLAMTNTSLCLLALLMAVASACSKSSADATANRTLAASELAAPPAAPAPTPTAPAKPAAPAADVEQACDDACTELAVCHERVFTDEDFRDGGGCVEDCTAMSPAERTRWVAEVANAHRTNQCARLFEEKATEPSAGTATLADGEPRMGCFAWSERANAAACVTGEEGSNGKRLKLSFVGGGPAAISLVDSHVGGSTEIDAALAGMASSVLALEGFHTIAGAPSKVAARKPKQVNGVTITFTSKTTSAGGDNIAPTQDNRVVASCGGNTIEVFRLEAEGASTSVAVRPVGTHALIEVAVHIGREGEFAEELHAVLVEAGSCNVAKAGH